MIKASFDLDLLFYYPFEVSESIKDIYYYLYKVLREEFNYVIRKNVSIRIEFPYEEDLEKHHFHIDVVPAKRKKNSPDEAWLFQSEDETIKRTSLEKHINAVQEFENYGVLKLLKLWKVKKRIDCPSIVLEQIANEATKNVDNSKLNRSELLKMIFEFMCYKLPNRSKIDDPANPNKNLLDDEILEFSEKQNLINSACAALKGNLDTIQGWKDIFKSNQTTEISFSGIKAHQRKGKIHPSAPDTRRFGS